MDNCSPLLQTLYQKKANGSYEADVALKYTKKHENLNMGQMRL